MKNAKRTVFISRILFFYGMMMALYLYYMLANLSSAPKFIYTAF